MPAEPIRIEAARRYGERHGLGADWFEDGSLEGMAESISSNAAKGTLDETVVVHVAATALCGHVLPTEWVSDKVNGLEPSSDTGEPRDEVLMEPPSFDDGYNHALRDVAEALGVARARSACAKGYCNSLPACPEGECRRAGVVRDEGGRR